MMIEAAFVFALAGALWLLQQIRCWQGGKPQPPGPTPLPLIGNLHIMGSHPHRSLHKLSKKYGPIMQVRLGVVRTVVVSSPEAAEAFLKTHDLTFASRPWTEVSEYALYGGKSVGLSPYSSYWRNGRKLLVGNMLTAASMEATSRLTKAEFRALVKLLRESAELKMVADVSALLLKSFERITYQIIFGEGTRIELGMHKHMEELLYFAAAFDPGQYIPFLRPLDPMGVSRGIKETSKKLDRALEATIEEYLRAEGSSLGDDARRGFLGKLLPMLNKPMDKDGNVVLDRDCVKSMLIDILAAALDTSFTASEWGMSELIRNPRVMNKLRVELDRVVGFNRLVEESDFSDLPYLDMVAKETLRLHPPAPLLVPHQSVEDVTVGGYFIPKNTRVLINALAIGLHPTAWPGMTDDFYPERFERADVDVHGKDFRLLPFGSGRRGCPGSKMALNAMKLVMAMLAHSFHWDLPHGASPQSLDMTDKFALATPRAHHLLAFPTYRLLC